MLLLSIVPTAHAGTPRKLLRKTPPVMPEIARKINLTGTVRLQATIDANGKVTAIKVLGGHPVLAQSATEAVKSWKYEPGAEEVTQIEVNFQ